MGFETVLGLGRLWVVAVAVEESWPRVGAEVWVWVRFLLDLDLVGLVVGVLITAVDVVVVVVVVDVVVGNGCVVTTLECKPS